MGVVLILAAVVVLVDVATVALFSAILIAWVAMLTGAFEVLTAMFRRPWTRSAPRVLLGVFYVSFGIAFLQHSEFRTVLLTYVLMVSLVGSGVVRLVLGFARQTASPWLLVSGCVGIAVGLAMLFNRVGTNDRTIGLLLGVDLLLHGIAWLMWTRTTSRDVAYYYR
jgi:uncharacterized membrane protein HdeD (DUF308 family)